jgi:hypothetical protein
LKQKTRMKLPLSSRESPIGGITSTVSRPGSSIIITAQLIGNESDYARATARLYHAAGIFLKEVLR